MNRWKLSSMEATQRWSGVDTEKRRDAVINGTVRPPRWSWSATGFSWGMVSVLAAAFSASGCRGPERAPHQPIEGVDVPREELGAIDPAVSGHTSTVDGGVGARQAAEELLDPTPHWLRTFAEEAGEIIRHRPGEVAVFPALTRDAEGAVSFDGLGEYLSEETQAGLLARGVRAVGGLTLESRLRAVNRSAGDYVDEWSALVLARGVETDYVVYGSVRFGHVGRRLDRAERIEVDWRCHDLRDDREVLRLRRTVDRDPDFTLLAAEAQQPSPWTWGASEGSVAVELERWVDRAFERLLEAGVLNDPDRAGERNVAVLPTVLPATGDTSRRFVEFAVAFQRAHAEARGRAEGEEYWEQPVTVGSARYPTLLAALDELRVLREQLERSSAGRTGEWVAGRLQRRLQAEGWHTVLGPFDRGRDALLLIVQDEASRAALEGSVDDSGIAWIRAANARAILRSRIEELPGGELELTLTWLEFDPETSRSVSEPVPAERLRDVREALGVSSRGEP